MSRRIRSFILCLAAGAIMPLALPGVASAQPAASATPAVSATATQTHTGGCDSAHFQPLQV